MLYLTILADYLSTIVLFFFSHYFSSHPSKANLVKAETSLALSTSLLSFLKQNVPEMTVPDTGVSLVASFNVPLHQDSASSRSFCGEHELRELNSSSFSRFADTQHRRRVVPVAEGGASGHEYTPDFSSHFDSARNVNSLRDNVSSVGEVNHFSVAVGVNGGLNGCCVVGVSVSLSTEI